MQTEYEKISNAYLLIVSHILELNENDNPKYGKIFESMKWIAIDEINFYNSFEKIPRYQEYQNYFPYYETLAWITGTRDSKGEKQSDHMIQIDYQKFALMKSMYHSV